MWSLRDFIEAGVTAEHFLWILQLLELRWVLGKSVSIINIHHLVTVFK